ncbi:MAG: hypothetical protein D6800_00020, partial [Candidatus Zixiibacteriota bacterium]
MATAVSVKRNTSIKFFDLEIENKVYNEAAPILFSIIGPRLTRDNLEALMNTTGEAGDMLMAMIFRCYPNKIAEVLCCDMLERRLSPEGFLTEVVGVEVNDENRGFLARIMSGSCWGSPSHDHE